MQMMKSALRLAAILLLGATVAQSGSAAQSAPPPSLPQFQGLEHKTGWILLGLSKADGVAPGSELRFAVVKPTPSTREFPKPNSKIRLVGDAKLVILGYRETQENRRNESPADADITSRDSTDIILKSGTELFVKEVAKSHLGAGNKRAVWARVAPIPATTIPPRQD